MNRVTWCKFAAMVILLAGSPIAPAADDSRINDAITQLADPDAVMRERATDALWLAGKDAEPALRQALTSDDPEVVRRARSVLVRLELGITPDTPQPILECIKRYRGGDNVSRWNAIHVLADQGNRGLHILLGLRRMESNESTRDAIVRAVSAKQREGAIMALADGDLDIALPILQHVAQDDDTGMRDWAAILLQHGGLDEQIAARQAELKLSPGEAAMKQLVYLARAKGDLALATQVADQASASDLVDSLLLESGDWKKLASRYRERPAASCETLAFTAAFCRLAGDAGAFETSAAAIRSYADQHEDEYISCANALILNDRVDEGVAILIAHKNYLMAVDFLQERLRFREALALLDQAANDLKPDDLLQLQAREISVHHFLGDRDTANQMLGDVAKKNEKQQNLQTWLLLAIAARQLGNIDQADEFLASAIQLPAAGDGSTVVEDAGLPSEFFAGFWWRILRTQYSTEPYVRTLKRLRDLAEKRMPAEEMAAVTDAARQSITGWPAVSRDRWLAMIGMTLKYLGQNDRAGQCFATWSSLTPNTLSLQSLADSQAAQGDFAKAAATYQRSWDIDRTRAVPLALRAWAQSKSGSADDAKKGTELAHELSLGNDLQRAELEQTFREHEMLDDARIERDLIRKTGRFLSSEVTNANRRSGDDAMTRGAYSAAVQFYEQAVLGYLVKDTSFSRPTTTLAIRVLVHKAHALALARQSPDQALREAQICLTISPGDADTMVDLVHGFEQAGQKAAADRLFASAITEYVRWCETNPNSGPAHNELAWAEGRCGRNLDDALKHALRALELEPGNVEIMDTLAEVYFQRGQRAEAIAQSNKCVALAPAVQHYKDQLARFSAAQTGVTK